MSSDNGVDKTIINKKVTLNSFLSLYFTIKHKLHVHSNDTIYISYTFLWFCYIVHDRFQVERNEDIKEDFLIQNNPILNSKCLKCCCENM